MSLCLNMIVKNEEHIIARCLKTVLPIISHYVIVDTGSTDNTIQIIKNLAKDVPGEIVNYPWQDFSHNRNHALNLARNKADYILLMDADESLLRDGSPVDLSSYNSAMVTMVAGDLRYGKIKIIDNDPAWHYEGVTHEALNHPQQKAKLLDNVCVISHDDSSRRNSGLKFIEDLKLLDMDRQSPRTLFYKAQTLFDLGIYRLAYDVYEKRILQEGWNEEVYYSLYKQSLCLQNIGAPPHEVSSVMWKAYLYRPTRSEAAYILKKYLRENGLIDTALSVDYNQVVDNDVLFIDLNSFWLNKTEHCLCLLMTNKKDQVLSLLKDFQERKCPDWVVNRINFYLNE